MELKGKKILFLGDSITEGVGVDCVEDTYWKQFEKMTGANCVGYGISGTRIAWQPDEVGAVEPYFDGPLPHFASRVESMEKDADVIVVFGGTNDYGHGEASLGKFEDRDKNTFCGAMHLLCQRLINRYPEAQIVFMTPLPRYTASDENPYVNDIGKRRVAFLKTYVDIIRRVAEFYSLPVLDLFRVSGIQPYIQAQKDLFVPDGLHPNKAGAKRIALRLRAFLESL